MLFGIEILLLLLVLIVGFIALQLDDLMDSAIVFGAYSFLMCLVWTGMGAVDVAFTEAAVGAGVSTVFFIASVYNTTRTSNLKIKTTSFKLLASVIVGLFAIVLISVIPDLPVWGDSGSPANTHVSSYYITHTYENSHVPNIVTAVLADYRAFDTMFETCVVFVAGLAIMTLLRRKKRKSVVPHDDSGSLIIKVGCRFMVPFMQLFGLYVLAHGHHSPGGGFQGGVILGASLILLAMSNNLTYAMKRLSEKWMTLLSAIGVLIFVGIGVLCIILGSTFLDYSVLAKILPTTDSVMARSHAMLGVEIGVALTVMAGMFAIYAHLSSDGYLDKGL